MCDVERGKKDERMAVVLRVMVTLVLCLHLQFVDRCNHVDTIVYDVGDGRVDLTV